MAYINTQDVKRIREALKVAFPEFRFSVRKTSGGMSVTVAIQSGPVDFSDIRNHRDDYVDVNHFHTHQYGEHQELFDAIIAVIKQAPSRKWYDKSDAQYDYFDTAFYFHLHVGQFGKPYEIRYPRKGIYHVPESYMEQAQTALALRELTA